MFVFGVMKLKSQERRQLLETKSPPTLWAGGYQMETLMFLILNYLPASFGSLAKPSRFWIAACASPMEPQCMPWNIPMTGDPLVGCGCLEYVWFGFMCAEVESWYSSFWNRSTIFITFFEKKFRLLQLYIYHLLNELINSLFIGLIFRLNFNFFVLGYF